MDANGLGLSGRQRTKQGDNVTVFHFFSISFPFLSVTVLICDVICTIDFPTPNPMPFPSDPAFLG